MTDRATRTPKPAAASTAPRPAARTARAKSGETPGPQRAYAIGDVHGHLDLLRAAHALIAADRARTGDMLSPVVHLGDLVDRGPESRGTLAYLIEGIATGAPWVVLKGNHDAMFARFLADPEARDPGLRPDLTWLDPRLGGLTTLASYGIRAPETMSLTALHTAALRAVPRGHIRFIDALPLHYRAAGAIFVHAGLRPGIPLAQQSETDLMWIRADFHNDPRPHAGLVVHGHTPVKVPTHYGNRVNLDTGAAYGGPLSVAVFEEGGPWVLGPEGRQPLRPSGERVS